MYIGVYHVVFYRLSLLIQVGKLSVTRTAALCTLVKRQEIVLKGKAKTDRL